MKKKLREKFKNFVVGIPEGRWRVILSIASIALSALGVVFGTLVGNAIYCVMAG